MLEIFFERKTFFQLKELEKIAPKEKGITPMSVKDVVQSLVDDEMVDCERIGTSNYFWSYPSKALHKKRTKLDHTQSAIDEAKQRISTYEARLDEAKEGKDDTDNRQEVLSRLSSLEQTNVQLKSELERYQESDPEVLEAASEQSKLAIEAANRWTDNIFSVKSWCQRKFAMNSKDLDKQFGIPEDFDYIEE